ncbi:MAG: hypothetical protein AAF228_11345 [Pseudomonadota bacterium]
MKFRFMGPCLTRVSIKPEQIVSAQENYLKFWDKIIQSFSNNKKGVSSKKRSPKRGEGHVRFFCDETSVPHSLKSLETRSVLYQTVLADTPMLPAHAAEFSFEISDDLWRKAHDKIIDNEHAYFKGLSKKDVSLISHCFHCISEQNAIRLYYSNIAILQFDIRVEPDVFESALSQEGHEATLNALEWFGIELFQILAKEIENALSVILSKHTPKDLKNVVTIAKEIPQGWAPLMQNGSAKNVKSKDHGSYALHGPVLWVTRSLFFENTQEMQRDIAQDLLTSWLTPVSQTDWSEAILNTGYSMQWLRYGFDEKAMSKVHSNFDDAWESMLFSQFFWAAMETVEHEMFAALGRLKLESANGVSLKKSYQDLLSVRDTAELTLAHYEHLKRYLTRTRVQLVEQIMEGWGFKSLVKNLRETIKLCNQRHQMLLQRASAQNSLFTDILLFFIGTVAIIELMITMSITGRTLSSDAALGLRNEGELDVLGLLSTLPMDRLLLSSVIIIGIIVYFYVRYRARQML